MLDAGVTLAWQEPISAFLAARAQATLERQLAAAERAGAAADDRALTPSEARRRADRYARTLRTGEAFGRIELPALGRRYVLVEGADTDSLRRGPGHYRGTDLPGQPGTVAVAGHRTTYLAPFRRNDRLRRGDEVVLRMPYGTFEYVVERTRVLPPEDAGILTGGRNRLVLTACEPLYSDAERLVVFARLEGIEPS